MGWSGGTYTKGNAGSGGWVGDASVGIGIEANRHDTQDDDFTAGINTCLTKDGQNTPTANLPMGSYKHTGVGNATNNDEYVALGQLDSISVALDGGNTPTADLPMGGFKHTGVDDATAADEYLSYGQLLDVTKAVLTGGTSPNYTVTLTPAPTAYTQGMSFVIQIHSSLSTNAGATLNVNGLGAKDLKVTTIGALNRDPIFGELSAYNAYIVTYHATSDAFHIANPTFGHNFTAWTPSVSSSSGTVTLLGSGNDNWYQYINANNVRIHFQCSLALSGASAATIELSLPITADPDDQTTFGVGYVSGLTGYANYDLEAYISLPNIRLRRSDQLNFPIDPGFMVYGSLIYTAD